MKSLLLPLAGLFLSTALVAGEAIAPTSPNDPLQTNAALQYWIAISSLPDAQSTEWLQSMKSDCQAPPQAEQPNSPYLQYFTLGATMPACSFGTVVSSTSRGYGALVPHIAHMRKLSRLMCARSVWRFQHHQYSDAIDDTLTVLASGTHSASYSSLIEALTAMTQSSMALDTLARYLPDCPADQRHRLNQELSNQRYQLLQAPGLLTGEYSMLVSVDKLSTAMIAAAKSVETSAEMRDMIDLLTDETQRTIFIKAMRAFHVGVEQTITLPTSQWSNEMTKLNTGLKNELASSPKALKCAAGTTSSYDSILTYLRRHSIQGAMLRYVVAQSEQTNGLEQLSDFTVDGTQVQVTRQGDVITLTVANLEIGKKPIVLNIGHGLLHAPDASSNGASQHENETPQPTGTKSF